MSNGDKIKFPTLKDMARSPGISDTRPREPEQEPAEEKEGLGPFSLIDPKKLSTGWESSVGAQKFAPTGGPTEGFNTLRTFEDRWPIREGLGPFSLTEDTAGLGPFGLTDPARDLPGFGQLGSMIGQNAPSISLGQLGRYSLDEQLDLLKKTGNTFLIDPVEQTSNWLDKQADGLWSLINKAMVMTGSILGTHPGIDPLTGRTEPPGWGTRVKIAQVFNNLTQWIAPGFKVNPLTFGLPLKGGSIDEQTDRFLREQVLGSNQHDADRYIKDLRETAKLDELNGFDRYTDFWGRNVGPKFEAPKEPVELKTSSPRREFLLRDDDEIVRGGHGMLIDGDARYVRFYASELLDWAESHALGVDSVRSKEAQLGFAVSSLLPAFLNIDPDMPVDPYHPLSSLLYGVPPGTVVVGALNAFNSARYFQQLASKANLVSVGRVVQDIPNPSVLVDQLKGWSAKPDIWRVIANKAHVSGPARSILERANWNALNLHHNEGLYTGILTLSREYTKNAVALAGVRMNARGTVRQIWNNDRLGLSLEQGTNIIRQAGKSFDGKTLWQLFDEPLKYIPDMSPQQIHQLRWVNRVNEAGHKYLIINGYYPARRLVGKGDKAIKKLFDDFPDDDEFVLTPAEHEALIGSPIGKGALHASRKIYAKVNAVTGEADYGVVLGRDFVEDNARRVGEGKRPYSLSARMLTSEQVIKEGYLALDPVDSALWKLDQIYGLVTAKRAAEWYVKNSDMVTANNPHWVFEELIKQTRKVADLATTVGRVDKVLHHMSRTGRPDAFLPFGAVAEETAFTLKMLKFSKTLKGYRILGKKQTEITAERYKRVIKHISTSIDSVVKDIDGLLPRYSKLTTDKRIGPAPSPGAEHFQELRTLRSALVKTKENLSRVGPQHLDILEIYKQKGHLVETNKIPYAGRSLKGGHGLPQFRDFAFVGPDAQKRVENLLRYAARNEQWRALKITDRVNAVGRLALLSMDASAFMIQLALLTSKPVLMASAIRGGFKAMNDPGYMDAFLDSKGALIARNPQMILASKSGTEFFAAAEVGGLLDTGTKMGSPVAPFQRLWNAAIDTAGVSLLEGLEHMVKTPKDRDDLSAFINAFRGLGSSGALGISRNQQGLESLALLAPRYNRAVATIISDAFNPLNRGLRNKLAFEALAKTSAATMMAFIGFGLARGDTPEQIIDRLNPASRNFMLFNIMGQNIGPGTKFRSILRTIGRMYDGFNDPRDDFSLAWMYDPALTFLRGNLSPVAGTALNIAMGRNFIGEPTRDSALQATQTFLGGMLTPIWLQTMFFEGKGTAQERVLRGITEFVGGRATAATPLMKFQAYVEQQFFEDNNRRLRYEDLHLLDYEKYKRTKEGKKLWSDYEEDRERRGRSSVYLQAIEAETAKENKELIDKINKHLDLGSSYKFIRQAVSERGRNLAATRGALADQYPEEVKSIEDNRTFDREGSLDYYRYLEVKYADDYDNPWGFDYDARDAAIEELRQTFISESDDGATRWENALKVESTKLEELHPKVTELQNDREILRPYWEIAERVIEDFGVVAEYQEYLRLGAAEAAVARRRILAGNPKLVAALRAVAREQDLAMARNPEYSRLLLKWDYGVPSHTIGYLEALGY